MAKAGRSGWKSRAYARLDGHLVKTSLPPYFVKLA